MRVFLLIVCILVFIVMATSVFSLDFARLSDYGWGYLTGKVIFMVLSLAGLFFTCRSIFKKLVA